MKTIACFLVLSFFYFKSVAVDYYSQGSVCPNALGNWDTSPAGDGAKPVCFTNSGDRFIIRTGHAMTTTGTWTLGGTGTVLQIENGGILWGNHSIVLTGVFQIDDGGTYIHNNKSSVSEAAGNSIFSGTELFAAHSNFEIGKWIDNSTGLPNASPGIIWGNLVINLTIDLGGFWFWNIVDGSALTINGNLDIRSTYVTYGNPTTLTLTSEGIQNIYVGGDFLLSGQTSSVQFKNGVITSFSGYTAMQVCGNISLTGLAQFIFGSVGASPGLVGLWELRFKGNFFQGPNTAFSTTSETPYLVANGVLPQTFSYSNWMITNFRIAAGATVNLASSLTLISDKKLVVSGTLNQAGYPMNIYGRMETAGGVFNSNGPVVIGESCTACSGLGDYNIYLDTWCSTEGTKGMVNFDNAVITLSNDETPSLISAGHLTEHSPGNIYFVNSSALAIGSLFDAGYVVRPGSILSLNENSYIGGDRSSYLGQGGILRVGSVEGIVGQENTTKGNVRSQVKNYDESGTNSFEFFGTSPQVTGSGLPAVVEGTLKINNSSGMGTSGVTLSQPVKITGVLDLSLGKLVTSMSELITIDSAGSVNVPAWGTSYIAGPVKKTGSTSFTFPVGKGNNYAPLTLTGNGTSTDEYVAEYFIGDPGVTIGAAFENPPLLHISSMEWWTVERRAGASAKSVTLEATTYSGAVLLSDLRVVRWDGSAWKNQGNIAYTGVSAGPVTSDIVNDFFAAGIATPFTFGSVTTFNNPLAVRLISFNATKLSSSRSMVTWELATLCISATKFELQRAGADKNFRTIATISGSETHRFYNYTDIGLQSGVNYYRLKMIDTDGAVSYSKVVAVLNDTNGLLLTSLIPSIVTGKTSLTISSSAAQKMDILIVDMQGRVVQRQNYTIAEGNTSIVISAERLPAGAYQLFGIAAEGKTNVLRFVKQ